MMTEDESTIKRYEPVRYDDQGRMIQNARKNTLAMHYGDLYLRVQELEAENNILRDALAERDDTINRLQRIIRMFEGMDGERC